ncbi:MAG: succinylglutamate desuccinylase/aspartoacylase family protein [Fulvivirga sp.]|nr:succinylglutamate desuccinylase/aspartoacylase family protein [Fulvivirga sp.]
MKKVVIDGQEILPGQEKKINAEIGRLPTRTPINIPVFVNRAKTDGPVLLVMAGMHGDETNGIEVVRRFLKNYWHTPTSGMLISIPVYNIYGFLNHSRGLPDGKDLNRSFPGSMSGSLASRVAHFLTTEILPQIDYGLDFHTGGRSHNNHPQIRAYFESEEDKELAQVFGAPFIIQSKFRDKSLRKTAAKAGKQILVYEGGETLRLRKQVIDIGLDGILRVMNHLGMREDAPENEYEPIYMETSSWVRAKYAGLHHSLVRNGTRVNKRQVIGLITDPYGQFEKQIRAPHDGYVIGVNNYPVVNMGDAVLHIGRTEI